MEIKDIVAIISPMIGISGLAFGLYQYTIAQRWKRSEFAAKHLEELSSDPELELCCNSTVVICQGRGSRLPLGHAEASDKDKGVSDGIADRGACSRR